MAVVRLLIFSSSLLVAAALAQGIPSTKRHVGPVLERRIDSSGKMWVRVKDNCEQYRQFQLMAPSDWDFIEQGDFVVLFCINTRCWLEAVIMGVEECPGSVWEKIQ